MSVKKKVCVLIFKLRTIRCLPINFFGKDVNCLFNIFFLVILPLYESNKIALHWCVEEEKKINTIVAISYIIPGGRILRLLTYLLAYLVHWRVNILQQPVTASIIYFGNIKNIKNNNHLYQFGCMCIVYCIYVLFHLVLNINMKK